MCETEKLLPPFKLDPEIVSDVAGTSQQAADWLSAVWDCLTLCQPTFPLMC